MYRSRQTVTCSTCRRRVYLHNAHEVGCRGPYSEWQCGGCYEDEHGREEETSSSKVVTARKARFVGKAYEIRPGDRVKVTSGFRYMVGGPRTGYFRYRTRVTKGPAWTEAN
jgi:hypothetical protein